MKFAKLAFLATAMAVTPIAANAQEVGATVYGNDDQPIGTVENNAEGVVTVNTGKHSAPLPARLFAEREIGWAVNATRAQIDGMMDRQVAQREAAAAEAEAARQAAIAEAEAKLAEALVVGAPVVSLDAQTLGLVNELIDENVVIQAEDESLITLPRAAMSVAEDGTITARANFADIMAAVQTTGG